MVIGGGTHSTWFALAHRATGTSDRNRDQGTRSFHHHGQQPVCAALFALCAVMISSTPHAHADNVPGHVQRTSTTELLELVFFEGARLLDVRSYAKFRQGHILGALPLAGSKSIALHAKAGEGRKLEGYLAGFGVTKSTHLILYDGEDGGTAKRTALRLHSLGYHRTVVLAGGLQKWLARGGTLSKQPVLARTPAFSSRPGPFQLTVAP